MDGEAPRSLISELALGELLEIAKAAPRGAFAEFGVYLGGSAVRLAHLARAQGRAIYLFDTFRGTPFRGPRDIHGVGDFGDTSYHAVRSLIPEAIMIPGVFPESVAAHGVRPDGLAFVHVDADQYESIAAAIRVFPALMVSGAAMLFDDYGHVPGATQAIDEWREPIEVTRQGKALWRKH